jgi:uncharacterized protein
MHSPMLPRVWAISDLHWSTRRPMHVYHEAWRDHRERTIQAWVRLVGPYDLVLVPGDITCAHEDPSADLLALHQLPGQKVMVPGNHDRWCQGKSRHKINELLESYPTLNLLSHAHPFYETGPHLIVGYKGADPPDSPLHKPKHHNKALAHAQNAATSALHTRDSYHKVIVITHYPPSKAERKIMAPLGVDLWLHGHCHLGGVDQDLVVRWAQRTAPPQRCVSSDWLHMTPLEVTNAVARTPFKDSR